jgi:DNA gyrase inhibitor GyrI
VLPAGYRLDNAPTPTREDVTLARVPARRVAVKRYSGWWNEASYRENLQLLQGWMRQNKLEADSEPRYAGYDPPWTLPFLRRNEIMIDIR